MSLGAQALHRRRGVICQCRAMPTNSINRTQDFQFCLTFEETIMQLDDILKQRSAYYEYDANETLYQSEI